MGRWLIVALSLVVGSLAVAAATADSIRVDLLIRHVNIIDVAGGPTLLNQRIGIVGDRITSIVPESSAATDDANVIDAAGAFVIPGLWDMHQHLLEYPGLPSASVPDATFPLYLANGVLGVRDMGTHDVATLKRLRDDITAGKLQGPRLVIAGQALDGRPPTDWLKRPVGTADEARQAVRDLKAAGVDFVKVYERLSKPAYLAIADECRRLNLTFVGHLPASVSAREATLAGQRSIEHMGQGRLRDRCYGYLPEGALPPPDTDPVSTATLLRAMNDALAARSTEGLWAANTRTWASSAAGRRVLDALQQDLGQITSIVVLQRKPSAGGFDVAVLAKQARGERTYRFHDDATKGIEWLPDEPDIELPSYVRALADELRVGGTWVTPTLTPLRAIARRMEMRASPDPRLEYVTREVRRELDPAADPRYQAWTAIEWDFIKRAYERDARLAVSLKRFGVRMLAGTDGITDYCLPGFGLHDELGFLVTAGFSPLEALQAATLEPAAFLNRSRDMGTVSAGKFADLVLLSADPLTDIQNAASIRAVVRGGRYLSREDLDRMLQRVRTLVKGNGK